MTFTFKAIPNSDMYANDKFLLIYYYMAKDYFMKKIYYIWISDFYRILLTNKMSNVAVSHF